MTPCLPEPADFHIKPQSEQTPRIVQLLLLAAVFVCCSSCAVSSRPGTEPGTQPGISKAPSDTGTNAETKSIINLPVVKLEQTSPLAQITEQIDDARVILVGETHTRLDHHLVQLEVMKLLYRQSPGLAIGVEWFQQPYQQYLDAYVAGDITEAEMLKLTGYYEHWRYDYRLYRPILQFAREHRIPVIALNASSELSHALGKSGFDDLPAELKAQLPASYDWSDKAYEKRLREVFEEHPDYPGEFEDFLRGQLTWDETMAERAAQYLDNNPESRLLIFAGSGHIAYGSGIPNRIKRRIDVEQFSILVSADYLPVEEDIADFLVLSTAQLLEPAGLIGALLNTEGKLLVINGFSDNSAAKDAGLNAGTVIISVNGTAVENFADFKLAVMGKKPGDSIELHYIENAEAGNKDIKSVKLELR